MRLEDQRTAMAGVMDAVYSGTVHPYPMQGTITPPCAVINPPSINFETPALGMVSWSIMLYGERIAQESKQRDLETALQEILPALQSGAGCQLVLQNVYPVDEELSGYDVPAYQINATSPLPNC